MHLDSTTLIKEYLKVIYDSTEPINIHSIAPLMPIFNNPPHNFEIVHYIYETIDTFRDNNPALFTYKTPNILFLNLQQRWLVYLILKGIKVVS